MQPIDKYFRSRASKWIKAQLSYASTNLLAALKGRYARPFYQQEIHNLEPLHRCVPIVVMPLIINQCVTHSQANLTSKIN